MRTADAAGVHGIIILNVGGTIDICCRQDVNWCN